MKAYSLPIKAVLFDFDGTLTSPGAIDFAMIKQTIGCPLDRTILEFIESLDCSEEQDRANAVLDRVEIAAAAASTPNSDAEALIHYLKEHGLPIAILTRNSMAAVERALENFPHLTPDDFDFIGSRELPSAPKPSPDGILHAAEVMGVEPAQMFVVGDYIYDVQAGNAAGATTVFLTNGDAITCDESDYTIDQLAELFDLVRLALPLPAGKLPNDLLDRFLGDTPLDDPSVLIGPGVGEDTAAVLPGEGEVLILKADPITFVSDGVGEFAVLINANDIATSGATPRWFLSTLLFPVGASAYEVRAVMADLQAVCRRVGVSLCGGHTEITDAVTRPIVSGTLVGTVPRHRLIDKRRMQPGDRILLTKGVAVEGSAIIAGEFADRLRGAGVAERVIEEAAGLFDEISILDEARIAAEHPGVNGMHDVTEGGLATALAEFAAAGGHGLQVEMTAIPVFEATQKLCAAFGLDPLGLIGSGSLLICVAADEAESLLTTIRGAGVAVTEIGAVVAGEGVTALSDGSPADWPRFAADELTRLY